MPNSSNKIVYISIRQVKGEKTYNQSVTLDMKKLEELYENKGRRSTSYIVNDAFAKLEEEFDKYVQNDCSTT